MHLDVQDLRNFYYRSALACRAEILARAVVGALARGEGANRRRLWLCSPLLRPYLADARRVMVLMPGPQGVMPWPAGMPNTSVLTEETLAGRDGGGGQTGVDAWA